MIIYNIDQTDKYINKYCSKYIGPFPAYQLPWAIRADQPIDFQARRLWSMRFDSVGQAGSRSKGHLWIKHQHKKVKLPIPEYSSTISLLFLASGCSWLGRVLQITIDFTITVPSASRHRRLEWIWCGSSGRSSLNRDLDTFAVLPPGDWGVTAGLPICRACLQIHHWMMQQTPIVWPPGWCMEKYMWVSWAGWPGCISRFRPKFWWKDLDDEEGMYMICLQALSGGFLLAPAPSVCWFWVLPKTLRKYDVHCSPMSHPHQCHSDSHCAATFFICEK